MSHSNTNPLNQNVSKQREKNYGKITDISASLAFLVLPMEQS
jgi:CRISPR/Cas system type I-B associated protein Csh2 (Cas7 group RAMP superfamily)